ISAAAPAVALPETFLGLVPGWGGATILPNLIGIERALKVVIENPLKQNRVLKPAEALELGIADVMFGPANYLESSLVWADSVLGGKKVDRPHTPGTLERTVKWPIALKIARETLEKKL